MLKYACTLFWLKYHNLVSAEQIIHIILILVIGVCEENPICNVDESDIKERDTTALLEDGVALMQDPDFKLVVKVSINLLKIQASQLY